MQYFQNDTIVLVNLVDGASVIARVKASNDKQLVLSKPLVLEFAPIGNGQMRVMMVPYLSLYGTLPLLDELEIDNVPAKVICIREAPEQYARQYMEATSGIALAPANSKFSGISQ